MNRREFVRTVAGLSGAAAASWLLEGCARGSATQESIPNGRIPSMEIATLQATDAIEQPVPTEATAQPLVERPMGRIALVMTHDRVSGINQAMDLLELEPIRGKNIFLKPNFNSSDPAPGSTHPETLQTIVARLQKMDVDQITVGDRSGMGNTEAVLQHLGVNQMAAEMEFETMVFDELAWEDWTWTQPEGSHWSQGFYVPRPVLEADGIIQTCCLKTHRFGGHFTLSLKNSVGLAAKLIPGEWHNYMNELHGSSHQRSMIAEINTAYQPDLVVLDGVQAFVDGGPDKGTLVDSGVILAGVDRIAIDAVGVAILRYFGTTAQVEAGRVFDQEQIARGVELNLGVSGPDEIEFITPDPASQVFAEQLSELLHADV